MPPGRHESSAPTHHKSGRVIGRRVWLPWLLGGGAVLIIAAVVFGPFLIGAMSVSVEDEDRRIELSGGDNPVMLGVPAGWALEQRPFASEVVLHTPDGAAALCFSKNEDAQDARDAATNLARQEGMQHEEAFTEFAPSGSEIVYIVRDGAGSNDISEAENSEQPDAASESPANGEETSQDASNDEAAGDEPAENSSPCGDHNVVMIAGLNPQPEDEQSTPLIGVRVGVNGNFAAYLGEIADIIAGVSVS